MKEQERSSLLGRKIVVTRAQEQMTKVRLLLEREGACMVECPSIRFCPPVDGGKVDRVISRLQMYQWIVFTSQNCVRFFFQRLKDKKQTRWPTSLQVAAIGDRTKAALVEQGVHVCVVPHTSHGSEELAQTLQALGDWKDKRVLVPMAKEGRDIIAKRLLKWGAKTCCVVVYETRPSEEGRAVLQEIIDNDVVDWIMFASPSAVKGFFGLVPDPSIVAWIKAHQIRVASIGRMTSHALHDHGVFVTVQPVKPSMEEMIKSMKNCEEERMP